MADNCQVACTVRTGPQRRLSTEEMTLFELWCWRRLLGAPWTARRSNLKEINPKYSLERQGRLTCCNTRGHKESDLTERLNYNIWECLFASQSHLSHLPRKLHLHFPNSDGQATRNRVQKNQTGPFSESL